MGHLCCVFIISSAEIKQGRRPDALPIKGAMSSRSQPRGCRAPGLCCGPCACPWLLLGPSLVTRLPVKRQVWSEGPLCRGLRPALRAHSRRCSQCWREPGARGPAAPSLVAAQGEALAFLSSQGLTSPQGPAVKCSSPPFPYWARWVGSSSWTGLVWGCFQNPPLQIVSGPFVCVWVDSGGPCYALCSACCIFGSWNYLSVSQVPYLPL